MINPITGEETEIENTECTWKVVEVHYDGTRKQYRAVKLDNNGIIKAEQLFSTKERAEAHIAEQ